MGDSAHPAAAEVEPSTRRSAPSRPLEEPAASRRRLAEYDHVAAVGEHELEVAAAERLRRPPAILDQPLLAHRFDGHRLDGARNVAGAGLDLHRARPVDRAPAAHIPSSPYGVRSVRRSGTRESDSTSRTLSTASRPA